jgi:GTPase SAR1 family protein
MWDGNKEETFDNIPNFFSTINKGIKDNKFRNVPIFLIQNKKDLNINSSQDNLEKNKIKESIEKIKKENNNIVFREISLLEKDDFMELILDIDRNLNTQKEKHINNNEAVNLVKFKEIPIVKKNNDFIIIKSIFLGDSNVGKKSIVERFKKLKSTETKEISLKEFLKKKKLLKNKKEVKIIKQNPTTEEEKRDKKREDKRISLMRFTKIYRM